MQAGQIAWGTGRCHELGMASSAKDVLDSHFVRYRGHPAQHGSVHRVGVLGGYH